MILLPLASIRVPESRQRQELSPDHVARLALSIQDLGLLQPVGVRQINGVYELRYGEHRLMAVADLHSLGTNVRYGEQPIPKDHIACVDLGTLDEITAKETEFAENDVREQLAWQERDLALAELHHLREAQAGAEGRKQTLLATATEALPTRTLQSPGSGITAVSDALIRTAHFNDPEVLRAKTRKEASKIIERKLEIQALELRAAALSKVQTSGRHRLALGRMEECVHAIPDDTIDVLITDPPYGIDAQDFGSQFSRETRFDDRKENLYRLMEVLVAQAVRFCRLEAHAYVFCDLRLFEVISSIWSASYWNVWPWPIIWHKQGASGALPRPDHGPRRMYECILYALRGDKRTLKILPDVITIPPIRDSLHPHEKPIELYLDLLSRSAHPGDSIADPFCGTGVVFRAANRLQLTAWGIELDPAMFALSEAALHE